METAQVPVPAVRLQATHDVFFFFSIERTRKKLTLAQQTFEA